MDRISILFGSTSNCMRSLFWHKKCYSDYCRRKNQAFVSNDGIAKRRRPSFGDVGQSPWEGCLYISICARLDQLSYIYSHQYEFRRGKHVYKNMSITGCLENFSIVYLVVLVVIYINFRESKILLIME